MVVSKRTGLPGAGVGWFLTPEEDFYNWPRERQQARLRAELQKVFEYPRWPAVLKALGLLAEPGEDIVGKASRFRSGGESEQHRRLKE
jgi:hypothetical protein